MIKVFISWFKQNTQTNAYIHKPMNHREERQRQRESHLHGRDPFQCQTKKRNPSLLLIANQALPPLLHTLLSSIDQQKRRSESLRGRFLDALRSTRNRRLDAQRNAIARLDFLQSASAKRRRVCRRRKKAPTLKTLLPACCAITKNVVNVHNQFQ